MIAPYLTELQARVKKEGIRIGSCELPPQNPVRLELTRADPYLYSGVHVSLIGHDVERVKELGQEVSLRTFRDWDMKRPCTALTLHAGRQGAGR